MAQLRCCRLQKAFLETPSESQTTIFSLRQLSGLLYVHLYNCLTNVHLPHQPGSSGRVGLGLPCTVIHLLNKCFEQINEQALISRVLPVFTSCCVVSKLIFSLFFPLTSHPASAFAMPSPDTPSPVPSSCENLAHSETLPQHPLLPHPDAHEPVSIPKPDRAFLTIWKQGW